MNKIISFLRLVSSYIIICHIALSATTWGLKKVPCPHSETDSCSLLEIGSYGGYIYRYYPDRLNFVFWPATLKEWVVTCDNCKWAVFRDDFEKLKKTKKLDVDELPNATLLGDKILNTLKIIHGEKADSAFALRWILQQEIPVSIPDDTIYALELRLLSEMYSESKTVSDSCIMSYLIGRYTLLKGDTINSENLFQNILKKSDCCDEIKMAASENLITCRTGLDISHESFRNLLGCYLYDSVGVINEESSLLYLNFLVDEFNKTASLEIENEIMKIVKAYGDSYASKPIANLLRKIKNKSKELKNAYYDCKRTARGSTVDRNTLPILIIGTVCLLSLVAIFTLDGNK